MYFGSLWTYMRVWDKFKDRYIHFECIETMIRAWDKFQNYYMHFEIRIRWKHHAKNQPKKYTNNQRSASYSTIHDNTTKHINKRATPMHWSMYDTTRALSEDKYIHSQKKKTNIYNLGLFMYWTNKPSRVKLYILVLLAMQHT